MIIYRGEIIKRADRPQRPPNRADWLDQTKYVNIVKTDEDLDIDCHDHDLHFDLNFIHRVDDKTEESGNENQGNESENENQGNENVNSIISDPSDNPTNVMNNDALHFDHMSIPRFEK